MSIIFLKVISFDYNFMLCFFNKHFVCKYFFIKFVSGLRLGKDATA